jgi:hypothetical protein
MQLYHIHTVYNVCEYIVFSQSGNQVFWTFCPQEAGSTPSVRYQKFVPGITYHMQKTVSKLNDPCSRKVQKT